jgi:hypothetical protein
MDLEFFKGILTNAAWDIIKWLLIIVVGGFIARRISIKKLNVRRAFEKFKINHFANYRNKLHKKVYVIKTANDNSSFVHKITENKLWYRDATTGDYKATYERYFYYQYPSGYIIPIETIAEHSTEVKFQDIDNDKNLEVLIKYKCGAHTTVLDIYRINDLGGIEKLTKNSIASDSDQIELTYSSGLCEVRTKSVVGNSIVISELWRLSDTFELIEKTEESLDESA